MVGINNSSCGTTDTQRNRMKNRRMHNTTAGRWELAERVELPGYSYLLANVAGQLMIHVCAWCDARCLFTPLARCCLRACARCCIATLVAPLRYMCITVFDRRSLNMQIVRLLPAVCFPTFPDLTRFDSGPQSSFLLPLTAISTYEPMTRGR